MVLKNHPFLSTFILVQTMAVTTLLLSHSGLVTFLIVEAISTAFILSPYLWITRR